MPLFLISVNIANNRISDDWLISRFTHIAAFAGVVIGAVMLYSLIAVKQGWWLPAAQLPMVKFNIVFCVLLLSIALLFWEYSAKRLFKNLATIFSGLVVLLCLLTIVQHFTNINLGIDELLFRDVTGDSTNPGRMNISSAFILLNLSIAQLTLPHRRFHLVTQVLLIGGILFLFLILLGNLGATDFSQFSPFISTALHSILAVFFIYAGTFTSTPLNYLKFSFEKKVGAYIGFTLVCLAVVFFGIRDSGKKAEATAQMLNHTREVLRNTAEVESDALQMQSTFRGFIISGEPAYIDLFESQATHLQLAIERLRKLTSDNISQTAKLDSLQLLIQANISRRKQLMQMYSPKDIQLSDVQDAADSGNNHFTEIRKLIEGIRQEETQLLAIRQEQSNITAKGNARAISLLQLTTGIFILAAFIIIIQNTRRRKRAEAELTLLNEDLENRVAQKTQQVMEQEKEYRFLLENMREGIQVIDHNWNYVFVNNAVIGQSKMTGEEFVGHSLLKKNPGIEHTELFGVMKECMEKRIPRLYVNEFTFRDGSQGWFELSIQPVPEGLFMLSMDVTERMQVQREKDILLETLHRSLNEIYIFDTKSLQYRYVNQGALDNLGYTLEEIRQLTPVHLRPDFNDSSYREMVQPLLNHEQDKLVFFTHQLRKDGTEYPVEVHLQLVKQEMGELYLAVVMDITDQKEAEMAIKDSEEKRRLIMNAAIDAIVCMDTEGKVIFWNPQAEKIFGYRSGEVEGRLLSDLIIPEAYRQRHEEGYQRYLRTGEATMLNHLREMSAIDHRGIKFPVELTILPISQGKEKFFCAFIRDITNRKQAEIVNSQLTRDLESRARQLEITNTELARFAHVASHDLQEPLRMVTSFLHLLEKRLGNGLDETNKQYMDFAVGGAERMKELIKDLLDYSRIGHMEEKVAEFDADEVLQQVLSFFQLKINESKANVIIHRLPRIQAVKSQIMQVFQNLLSNALKYQNGKAPEVEIGYEDSGDEWRFFVKDNGIGIQPKYFEKIFIIFQRLHNKSDYSGTGIGLAMCKKIIENHGGDISVMSEEGKGSIFYFTIPKRTAWQSK